MTYRLNLNRQSIKLTKAYLINFLILFNYNYRDELVRYVNYETKFYLVLDF